MHARGVVETLDVGEHASSGFFTRLEASAVRLLDFQAVPEALHRRIVIAVSRAAPGLERSFFESRVMH